MIFSYMFRLIALLILPFLLVTSCKPSSTSISESAQDISCAQAAQLHKEGYKYIDIRTTDEIKAQGQIEGSQHIDYKAADFDSKIAALDKNQKYIVYCASGGRSGRSKKIFQKHGLTIANMEGGYNQWTKENK